MPSLRAFPRTYTQRESKIGFQPRWHPRLFTRRHRPCLQQGAASASPLAGENIGAPALPNFQLTRQAAFLPVSQLMSKIDVEESASPKYF